MQRTQLRFQSLQQIAGNEDVAVVILTDNARQRALSLVCDGEMTRQLLMRLQGPRDVCKTLLPEVLIQMLPMFPSNYELMVVGIFDGQYQVVLMDIDGGTSVRVRMSDAILLSMISHIPLYIEEGLMQKQCTHFEENAQRIAIPINTMDTSRLQQALDHAVESENYELASQLRDEIKRRTPDMTR